MTKVLHELGQLIREVVGFNLILWGIKIAPRSPENEALLIDFARFLNRTQDRLAGEP